MWRAVLLCAAALAGCGYHFAGDRVAIPDDVRSVSIGRVENLSDEPGMEKLLGFALQREIHLRRGLRLEEGAVGDAVLSGTLHELRARPVAFNPSDQAALYEVTMVVDLALTRQRDGKVLWRVKGMREVDEYATSGAVIVTSSSKFQRGTLDVSDLDKPPFSSRQGNRVITLPLAETERRNVYTRLLSQVAHNAYDDMMGGF